VETQVVVPREKVQLSWAPPWFPEFCWPSDWLAADACDRVTVVGAVGASHASRRMRAMAMAVMRGIMGDSSAVEAGLWQRKKGKAYALSRRHRGVLV
jgi:hypothetical protein